MERFKYRTHQMLMLLLIILTTFIYCIVVIFFWCIYFLCGYFWKEESFDKMSDQINNMIPKIEE